MSKLQLHALILTVILGLAIVGTRASGPLTVRGRPNTKFERIPMEFAGWVGLDGEFPPGTATSLPTCSLLLRRYMHEDVYSPLELALVYGTDLGDFHQPEFCLEGQGLRSVSKGTVLINGGDGTSFEAVKVIMDSEYGRRAFVFWFYSEGISSTSLGRYKVKVFLNRLLTRDVQPSAMVRLSIDVLDTDEEAIDQLARFAELIVPYLRQEFAASGQEAKRS